MKVRDTLKSYFETNGFGDRGGYDNPTLTFKILDRFPVTVPNTQARKRAVFLHDLHHLVTDYATDFRGECQIAGFEFGGGMGPYLAGWAYNASAFGMGLIICPRLVKAAFYRGCNAKTLYIDRALKPDELFEGDLDALKAKVFFNAPRPPTVKDRFRFFLYVMAMVLAGLLLPVSVLLFALAIALPPRADLAQIPDALLE